MASVSRYPKALVTLIEELQKLPGIGERSAERLAMHVLKQAPDYANDLSAAILEARKAVRHCATCFNLSEDELCDICADDERDPSLICVVETPRDLNIMESRGVFAGVYHCLLGRIAPAEGMTEADLTIPQLVKRCKGGEIEEVVIGTNPDLGGDATALAVARALHNTGVKVTRLARGIPMGYTLDALPGAVLEEALEGRTALSVEGGRS